MNKSLLISLLLAASINCQVTTTIKGCFQWNSFTNSCALCFRRQLTTTGICGPLLSSTDPCWIHREPYGSSKTICGFCAPGYALNSATGACDRVNIFNCLNAQYDGKTAKCLVCGGGQYPTEDGTACAPAKSSSTKVGACDWGTTGAKCYKCDPGYVISRDNTGCYGTTTTTIGCQQLNADDQTCFVCDAFNGYSMQKDGTCKFIAQ